VIQEIRTRPLERPGLLHRGAPFAVSAVVGVLASIISNPEHRRPALLLAAAILTAVTLAAAVWLPWRKLPQWLDALPAYLYVVVVFLLREGTGGGKAAFAPLLLLPLFWLALYGTRAQLAIAFALTTLVLALSNFVGDVSTNDIRFAILAAIITPVVCFTINNIVQELEEKKDELESLALTDQLTGLPNRREWERQLPQEIARARRLGTPLCIAMLDLDHFKRYNDERGHQAGDELLRNASMAWLAQLRETDLLARYGGEEFAIALPAADVAHAEEALERLRGSTPDGQTASAGIACWNGTESPHELVARADEALYEAKRTGRDKTVTRREPAEAR
jgi:diguanylate cyclase (GGDEF)-like protein